MIPVHLAYRDETEGARIRYEDLRERRAGAQQALAGAARVRGRRVGRIAAWIAGLGAFGALAVMAVARVLSHESASDPALTQILLAAWPAMAVAYAAGRVDVWGGLRERVVRPFQHDDLQARIARLEEEPPVEGERRRADRLERASVALPMMAIALLAPLTIHYAVYAAALSSGGWGFDTWILMSLGLVGHAHLTLAYLCYRFARCARALPSEELRGERSRHEWSAFGLACLAAAIPGALWFLIPPLITAVTGVCFNPLMFRGLTRAIVAERSLLGTDRALA